MRKTLFVIIMLVTSNLPAQNKAIEAIDALLKDHYQKNDSNDPDFKTYEAFLNGIKTQEWVERKFTGKLGFSLTLNNSQNTDLSQIGVAASVNRGFYPGEFNFDSELNVQLQDGKFVENISNVSMSYDHHFAKDLKYEGYAFVKRTTNNFLNINQRYEVGIGVVTNIFLSGKGLQNIEEKELKKGRTEDEAEAIKEEKLERRLTEKGKSKYKKVTSYKIQDGLTTIGLGEENNEAFLNLCGSTKCQSANLTEPQKTAFRESADRTIKSIAKMESKWRVSFLAGINYETERTTDSLKLFRQDSMRYRSFDPVSLFRLVAAPNIEVQAKKVKFQSRCYFKLAVSDGTTNNKVFENDNSDPQARLEDEKMDFRIEWLNKLSFTVDPKIEVSINHMFVHINAPRRQFIDPGGDEGVQLFEAANRFNNVKLALTFKL